VGLAGAGDGAVPGAGAFGEDAPTPFAIDPTREAPMNVAPSSIASVPAAMSPVSRAFDFNSQRSETVMFPSTSPKTVTDLVLISPLTCAFSPTVKLPSETTSPSIFPSMIKSCENFRFPTISTSLERMFLLVLMRFEWCEAMGLWGIEFIDCIGPGPSAVVGLSILPDPAGSWLMICLSTALLNQGADQVSILLKVQDLSSENFCETFPKSGQSDLFDRSSRQEILDFFLPDF
jgi:hypothetical protein